MKLEDIGFYTLSDARAKQASVNSPLWRCELILTSRCNFKCPYCRGVKQEYSGDMPLPMAEYILSVWANQGLKNIRFSGGEPTLYDGLDKLVALSKGYGIKNIALSTNGSADKQQYDYLYELGVNDFSISLDACCAEGINKMAGVNTDIEKIKKNIKHLSAKTYVTVGIVLTDNNIKSVCKIVAYANDLGVSDIRVIPAAQHSKKLPNIPGINKPIYNYRKDNIAKGRPVRGISIKDSPVCRLVLDDMAIIGEHHYPCIIYLREQGNPIGSIYGDMRKDREKWMKSHNSYNDPICKNNCLDVCVDYNNKCRK